MLFANTYFYSHYLFMSFEHSYLTAPLLGGIIGYITNDIAIRRLFRPHTAKYILGVHIPFTPRIIPKEKSRIAETIGSAISENLMNKEVLEKYLLSDKMVRKIRGSIALVVCKPHQNTLCVRCGYTMSLHNT